MKKFPVVAILEDIRSALNVGAIFRTCDGAGVEKLYLTGITPYPPHNRIPKTALGAVEMMDWEYVKSPKELVLRLKEEGWKIVSVELDDNAVNYWEYEYPEKTALIFGNEITGVSKELMDLSDGVIYIPMFGEKESLNVATTFGISIYEVVRQLSKNGK